MTEKPEQKPDELKKLTVIAADMQLAPKLRTQAIELIRQVGTYEALLALLELGANENLNVSERDLALKKAREIVKSAHS